MNSDLIMKSDVLDIIFENRNKAYGAYDLRKYYQSRLYKSIGIMLLCVGLLFCLTFFNGNKKAEIISVIEPPILMEYHPKVVEVPKSKSVEKPLTKSPVIPLAKKPSQQNQGNKIVYIDSLKKINDQPNIVATNISAPTVMPSSSGNPGGSLNGGVDGKPIGVGPSTNSIDINTPMATADIYPSFPGGDEALKKFLQKNLKTPDGMPDDATIGVQVEFVVGYDGKLKSFKIIKDGGDDFNNEVIRVLKKMPNWIPGKSNGHNVSVYHIIPVKFVSSDVNP